MSFFHGVGGERTAPRCSSGVSEGALRRCAGLVAGFVATLRLDVCGGQACGVAVDALSVAGRGQGTLRADALVGIGTHPLLLSR